MQMRCNRCWNPLARECFSTLCGHTFCIDCGNANFGGPVMACSACNRRLGQSHVMLVDRNPSEEWKTMILAGLEPEIILEISKAAMACWIYQTDAANSFLQHEHSTELQNTRAAGHMAEERAMQISHELERTIHRLKQLEEENQAIHREKSEVESRLEEKSRQKRKLEELYDCVRRGGAGGGPGQLGQLGRPGYEPQGAVSPGSATLSPAAARSPMAEYHREGTVSAPSDAAHRPAGQLSLFAQRAPGSAGSVQRHSGFAGGTAAGPTLIRPSLGRQAPSLQAAKSASDQFSALRKARQISPHAMSRMSGLHSAGGFQSRVAGGVAASYVAPAIASLGDNEPGFQHCLDECLVEECAGPEARKEALERRRLQEAIGQIAAGGLEQFEDEAAMIAAVQEVVKARNDTEDADTGPAELPFALKLLRWTCDENCAYECMHAVTEIRLERNETVLQYYGKWPFVRVWGIQEPASVLFSLANLAVHAYFYRWFRRKAPSNLPFRRVFMLSAAANVNAWLWSAVFHCRDTPLTEKLDYFSAGLVVLGGLYAALLRIHNAWNCPRLIGYTFVLLYIAHVSYLSFGRFDYGYNMAASVAVGALHTLAWVVFVARTRRPHAWMLVVALLGLHAAIALELGDFPPVWLLLDAHSLWHAATPLLAVLWYRFLQADARFELELHSKTQ
eukprot:tig00000849_g4761.t1